MSTTWFVTGISSGLGKELAQQLLAAGSRVAGTVRERGSVASLESEYGDRLWTCELDVTDVAAVRSVVDRAFGALGRIDVVVNNAGYGLFGSAESLRDDQIDRQVSTNLVGAIAVIRASLPHLRAQGGGRILQISSEGGQVTFPNFSLYHATKWGIEGFVETVAQEVASFGITFTIVEPGATRTNFGTGLVRATELSVYDETPVGEMKRRLASGDFSDYSDKAKVVREIVASATRRPAPRRLVLGRGAYERIRATLEARIAELDAQKAIAISTEE